MKSGKKIAPEENLPQGKTRDIVAKELQKTGINISGRTVSDLIKSVKKIDSYIDTGKFKEAAIIRHELHKSNPSCSTINRLADNMDKLSETDKQELLDNKTTANKILKKVAPTHTNKAKKAENTESLCNKINDNHNAGMLFQDELLSLGDHVEVIKSKLEELQRIASNNQVLSFYPSELINSLKAMSHDMKNNLEYLKIVDSLCDIELVKKIEPITKLEFWEKFYCFGVQNNKCYTLKDDVIFTILESLALITNASVWMYQDVTGYFGYGYNINKEMIYFAKRFKTEKNEAKIKKLIALYEQFNDTILEINDLTPKEWRFFDKKNMPYMINMLDYFNSSVSSDISFKEILIEFLKSSGKDFFEDCMGHYSDEYDLTYADENVEARIDFLKGYIDDYIEDFENNDK